MDRKTCIIIQPGAFGDILAVAGIASYYSNSGYDVIWPAREKYINPILRLPYVTPILLDDRELDPDWLRSDVMKILDLDVYKKASLILNLADRGPHSTYQRYNENFEQAKYRAANLPLYFKHNLIWERKKEKELSLKSIVCPNGAYVFAHLTDSYNKKAAMPEQELPVVEAREIEGYDIFDWYEVILGASEIFAVESSFFHFIDGIIPFLKTKPYVLRREVVEEGTRACLSQYWNHKFIGDTILKG
jgi:hypothetical protein